MEVLSSPPMCYPQSHLLSYEAEVQSFKLPIPESRSS